MKYVILAIALTLLLAGCASLQPQEKVMKVGVVAPMTGDVAFYGEDTRRAIELAQTELTTKTKVIYEDACVAQEGLKAAQKLVNIDQVDAVTGVFCIPSVLPIATLTEEREISVMMNAAVPKTIIENSNYVFSTNVAIVDEAYAQAEFAYNKLGARTASIGWLNSDFGAGYSEAFTKRFEELGGEILTSEALEFFGKDYRTELLKVKEADPDVFLAIHFGNPMALIISQSELLGLDMPIIGDYETEDQKILDATGSAAEGIIISSPVDSVTANTNFQTFAQKYKEAYGEEPTILAALTYDAFVLQVNAYDACNGDNSCVINHLKQIKEYQGVSGEFSISKDGATKREFIFKQVRDGKFVLYE